MNVVGVYVPTSSPSEGLAVIGLTHNRGTVTGLGLISGLPSCMLGINLLALAGLPL